MIVQREERTVVSVKNGNKVQDKKLRISKKLRDCFKSIEGIEPEEDLELFEVYREIWDK